MKKIFSDNIVAIDVGTTKICVLIARESISGLEVIGIGRAPSDGLRKGVVVNIAKTVESIKTAVKEAELMANCTIDSAYIGISGGHVKAINSIGVVPIRRGEVRQDDITNVIAAAKAVPLPQGQQVLHVLPQYFIIDSQEKVQNPLGMCGVRLEARVHIITGAVASVQNLVKCCEMANVRVNDIVLEPLASASAVLSHDECELGVGMLDIGGGTADFAIYQNGSIKHTKIVPIAGNHFTNDVAVGLRTALKDAERIKKNYGLANLDLLIEDKEIEVEMVQSGQKQMIKQSDLTRIIQPRAEELLTIVRDEVAQFNLEPFMVSGLVLTGGGSLLNGLKELAERIFTLPVRLGVPNISIGVPEILKDPMYATGYGLLLYVTKKPESNMVDNENEPVFARVFLRMKSWVVDFF